MTKNSVDIKNIEAVNSDDLINHRINGSPVYWTAYVNRFRMLLEGDTTRLKYHLKELGLASVRELMETAEAAIDKKIERLNKAKLDIRKICEEYSK